jgi:WD40 repeat protein
MNCVVSKLACTFALVAGVVSPGFAQPIRKPAERPAPKAESSTPTSESRLLDTDALPNSAIARFGTHRFRPGGSVIALAFDPSGKRLASWGDSARETDQFVLWDAETGKEIRSDRTTSNSLLALAWPTNGVGVAIVSGEHGNHLNHLKVWEFSGEKPTSLRGPRDFTGNVIGIAAPRAPDESICDAAAISAEGKRVAVATGGGKPGSVFVFESKPNTVVADLKKLAQFDPPPMTCSVLAFTPDGKRLIGFCPVLKGGQEATESKVIVWNANGKIARTIDGPVISQQGSRLTVAVSNELAAIGLEDGDTVLIELDSAKTRTIATAHKSRSKGEPYGTYAVAFSPDGKSLATAGRDGMVRVSDIATGKVSKEFGKHSSWPEAIAFSADGKRIASAGQDAVIRVWDLVAGKEVATANGHPGHVWRAGISADGKTVITEGGDGIRIWDAATGVERRRIAAGGDVTFCKLSPDSKQVIAIVGSWQGAERSFKVWDVATGKEATPAAFPKSLAATGFRFSPDGKSLITYHDDKLDAWTWPAGTKVWAADMPKPVRQPGINQVQSVAFSPDGRQFVTVAERSWHREEKGLKFGYGADGIVDVWDAATGKSLRRLVESQGCFRPGMYSADGLYIHSGGGMFLGDVRGGSPQHTRAQLCAVDPLTGRLVREFARGSRTDGIDSGFTMAISADGKALFRATGIGEVQIYEVATGSYRTSLAGHKANVLALDTPTDVRRLVSGSWDSTALLWNVGFDGKKGTPLAADERAKQWEALTDPDGSKAYQAMVKLASDPDGFIAIAKSELKPAPAGPKADDLAPIFRDLDSKTFTIREAASAKLNGFGEGAIALVRAHLEIEVSAEVRERLKRFLEKCEGPASLPTRLRQSRSVEVLEHLGTAEAKSLLDALSRGGASHLTTDAIGALRRIQSRQS